MPQADWVHPDAVPLVEALRDAPSMDQVGVEASRNNARRRRTTPPREDVAQVEGLRLPSRTGQIPARLYRPDREGPLPIVVYLHAGGWILGDLGHSDHLCRRLANRSGCAVLNIEYRLAPEHPYPAALDDCEDAYQWVRTQTEFVGLDGDIVAVAGESSGGNLAAALTLRTLRAGDDGIRFLLLLCAGLDPSMQSASWREFGEEYVPATSQMRWMWDLYLAGSGDVDVEDVNPLRASDLTGHPPTLVVTAELDPLRDEAENYGRRLADAGVQVSIRREIGLVHAFSNLAGSIPAGGRAFDAAINDLRVALVSQPPTGQG